MYGGHQQPMILEESKERFSGKLKFFDEQKNYGFIVMDMDKSDIFVLFSYLRSISMISVRPISVRNFSRPQKMAMKYCFLYFIKGLLIRSWAMLENMTKAEKLSI